MIDEHVEERTVVGRRGSTSAPFRIVSVELPDGGLAELHSDDLQVGTTGTV